jgi:hypothetical protein
MLGGKIVESQQSLPILGQAFDRLLVFDTIGFDESGKGPPPRSTAKGLSGGNYRKPKEIGCKSHPLASKADL